MFAQLVVLGLLGQVGGSATDPSALLERLGSARKAEQEAAKSLEGLGAKALPALRAALKSKEPEVRSRARAMIRTIEGNILSKESLVQLDFENATPGEVARSISRQVGFDVGLGAQGPNPGAYRITIHEPKPMAFWDAIDRISEATPFTFELQYVPRRGIVLPPSLSLSYRVEPSTPPSSNQGPFHVTVESLFFQSHVTYQGAGRPAGPAFSDARTPDLGLAKAFDPPAQPEPAKVGPGTASRPVSGPSRLVQFQVRFRVVAEPRMVVRQVGQLRLAEAVDDLGNALLPDSKDGDLPPGGMSMMPGMPTTFAGAGSMSLMTHLRRPDRPGKLIKKVKGAFDVVVAAPRPNPLVIPIEGAAGRTFENDDWRVVFKSIELKVEHGPHIIEMVVDDLEGRRNSESLDSPIGGLRGGFVAQGPIPNSGMNTPLGSIQVITTDGQTASYRVTFTRSTGRVMLTVNPLQQGGSIKEIRITSQVVARTNVSFEFHDLPMP